MKTKKSLSESGQSMVIIVLGLIAFVAILALVLDGGNAYAAKRQAQNAADAGAIAGATYMCKNHDEAGGGVTAKKYALSNGADDPPTVVASLSSATVMVTASVTKNTFFAGVIGIPHVSAQAVAEAACRPPGVGVLPVAWSCRANVSGALDCTQKINPDPVNDPYNLNYTYIMMDSVKVKNKNCKNPDDPTCYTQNDLVCSPQAGTPPNCAPTDPSLVDCDLNNDCIDELMTGGARSWLDLNGSGGGAKELINWISGAETPPSITPHTWLPEESGIATSIFQNAATYMVGKDVILPVFNKVCTGMPNNASDPESAQACNYWWGIDSNHRDNLSLITNSTLNFHIISFSAFHVTCVQTGKNKNSVTAQSGYVFNNANKWCNGHYEAVNNNPPAIDANDKTIEGFFTRLNLGGYSGPGDWVDTGTFTVILVR